MSLKDLSTFGSVISNVKSTNNFIAVESFAQLTKEMQKSVFATTALGLEEKKILLTQSLLTDSTTGLKATIAGLTEEEARELIATSASSTADKAATASTISLSAAHKGLAASLGISTAALTAWIAGIAVVSAAFIGYRVYSQYQEELASSTRAAADEFVSASESIDEYAEYAYAIKKHPIKLISV